MELTDYITSETVFFITAADKRGALDELIAKSLKAVRDPADFALAIQEREGLMSTGIGLGVAIPHAKLAGIERFFVVTGILKNPVEWDALDHKPVKLVFLIGGPEDSQGDYLRLLARIMALVKDDAKREKLKAAATAADVIQLIT